MRARGGSGGTPPRFSTIKSAEVAERRVRGHFTKLVTANQFAAVIDAVFDLWPRRTSPAFAELCIVNSQLVFARAEGETAFRYFVGRLDQLSIDLLGFVTHLGLGDDERAYVQARIAAIPAGKR